MSHYISIKPLYLLHQVQAAVARWAHEVKKITMTGLVKLYHQYRRAFNRTAEESSENQYYDDLSRRC